MLLHDTGILTDVNVSMHDTFDSSQRENKKLYLGINIIHITTKQSFILSRRINIYIYN